MGGGRREKGEGRREKGGGRREEGEGRRIKLDKYVNMCIIEYIAP